MWSGIGEKESERLGVDCPGYGVAKEGDSRWCSGRKLFNVFDGRTFTFDCCTYMSGETMLNAKEPKK